jgi:hypothetical protein
MTQTKVGTNGWRAWFNERVRYSLVAGWMSRGKMVEHADCTPY